MEHNEFCPYCDHFIEEGMDPIIDFPCLHRAHTTCFLQLLNNETHSLAEQYRRCQFCEAGLFETEDNDSLEDEEEQEQEQEQEQNEEQVIQGPEQENVPLDEPDENLTYYERIRKRFHENQQMQRDVKAYIKAKQACGPKRVLLKKCIADKKQEIKHSVESLREQLGSLLGTQKKSILQSQPFKDYKGAFFKATILRAKISRRYTIDMDALRRAIADIKGYKRWTRDFRWRDSPGYVLRRAFYRRYIRY